MALLEAFRKYISDNDLATHDDRILLTVSGGVDSMVMLYSMLMLFSTRTCFPEGRLVRPLPS